MSSPGNPLVSIIIPCYNYGRYLPATIDSLLAQTYSNWECLLINNASSDNTKEVCKRYQSSDKRFQYFETDNKGPAAARNKGLREAKGEYIQFLDADDLLEEDKLQVQVDFLQTHRNTDLAYGEVRYFTDENPSLRKLSLWHPDRQWMPEISGQGYKLIKALVKYNIMTIHAPIFRASVLHECGLMDEDLRGFEDWDFWLQMALHGKDFAFIAAPASIALVRSHPGSLNRDTSTMRKYLLRVWLKAMKSGRMPFVLFPYVLFRFEEEFIQTLIDAIKKQNAGLISGHGISFPVLLISILLMPVFLPFYVLAKLIRKLS